MSAPDPTRRLKITIGTALAVIIGGGFAAGFALKSGNAGPEHSVIAAPLVRPDISLGGSNTIGARLAPELVAAFFRDQGCVDVAILANNPDEHDVSCVAKGRPLHATIAAHGSNTAFQGLADGNFDIGMASRRIKPDEVTQLAHFGDMVAADHEHVIALDGIAVIVNPANRIGQLTRDQLAGIFSGFITDWGQLGGTPGLIHVYARDDNSGTFEIFKTLLLSNTPLTAAAARIEDSGDLSRRVASDPGAIGFVGLGSVGTAKPVAVAAAGAMPLQPNRFTVATEDYVFSRRLFLYQANPGKRRTVDDFLAFVNSPKGQEVVDRVGFIPLTINPEKIVSPAAAPPDYQALVKGALRLSVNFRFKTAAAIIDNRGLADIDRLAMFLQSSGVASDRLMLFGFADSRGTPEANLALSQNRAQSVADGLSQRGLHPRIVHGYGSVLPVADNSTADGQEKNRRVEVWIHP